MIPPNSDPNDPIGIAKTEHFGKMLAAYNSLRNNPMAEALYNHSQNQRDAQVEERRLEIAKELKGREKPGPLPPQRSVKELLKDIEKIRANPKGTGSTLSQPRVRTLLIDTGITYFGEPRYFSKAKMEDLKPVMIQDMQTWKQHTGCYLLCRIISNPTLGGTMLVADAQGSTIILEAKSTPILPISIGSPTQNDVDATFPMNAVLAIKEPTTFIKEDLIKGDTVHVRVDSPSDLVKIKNSDTQMKGVKWLDVGGKDDFSFPAQEKRALAEWKTEGNGYYTDKRYIDALKSYDAGIEQHGDHTQAYLLHLNKAAVNLTLERYAAALESAKQALDMLQAIGSDDKTVNAVKEKARFRVAKAYYGLHRWIEAEKHFKQCLDDHPDSVKHAKAKSLLNSVCERSTAGRTIG